MVAWGDCSITLKKVGQEEEVYTEDTDVLTGDKSVPNRGGKGIVGDEGVADRDLAKSKRSVISDWPLILSSGIRHSHDLLSVKQ